MYKPYRAALEAVRREFDRAATRHPGLFHEMLEYYDENGTIITSAEWEDGVELLSRAYAAADVYDDSGDFYAKIEECGDFSDDEIDSIRRQLRRQRAQEPFVIADVPAEIWRAFVEANKEGNGWQSWDIMPTGPFLGRFYGSGEALDDFKRLGETLSLILNEMIPSESGKPSYWQALLDFYRMADSHPSPLLRICERAWGRDKAANIDELLSEWKTNQLGQGYPLYPYCWGLVHDVFTSAISAIDAILEPDNILLLSEARRLFPSPLFGALKDIEEPHSEAPAAPAEIASTATEPYLFQSEGDYWHLRFTSGDRVEEHKGFRHRIGFLRYQELLREKGRKISSLDLQRLAKELEKERVSDEEAIELGLSDGFGFDPVTDLESMKALKEEITKTEEALELARGQPAQLQSLNRKLKLLHKLKSESKLVGRDRRLGSPPPEEKARKAINRCFAEVREAIRHKMPSLELHLLSCVECENGDWVYKPSPDLDWSF